ncbi:GTPase [Sphaerisporangium fuscum]|uniref:GTPase n=1 Tax=Sphaerisporangium fuscum TaxID=2835868 RepID=UPI001BDC06FB|nr:GTPase [Sphaerisporangium fuscum]
MKVLRRRAVVSLDDRLAALAEAAGLAEGRLDPAAVQRARAVVARAGTRRSLSVDHTVVALAGATGSGKSSLFNALSDTSLAAVGVTRPTTSWAQAAMWVPEGSGPLLDWLEIPRRHALDGPAQDRGEALSGLILLDLPDHDSIELSHRLEVDRLVDVVDLLVWVLDPQKYADAAVHERYLRRLRRHRDVMVVVLNQVDRLTPDAAGRCLRDLRRLLDDDGLSGVPVIGTSVTEGAGIGELRAVLAERVANRQAWAARLAADTGAAADVLASASSGPPAELDKRAEALEQTLSGELARPLATALAEAAGVPLVVEAVAKAHRHRSAAATGWPVTRWLRRFRPDPLRRLRVGLGVAEPVSRAALPAVGAASPVQPRTSIPAATAVQRSHVDTAIRDVGHAAAEGLPEPWAPAVRQAARSRADELAERLDVAVAVTASDAGRRPRWWRAAGLLQWVIFAAMLAGLLWLSGLFLVDYLRLPPVPTPMLGPVPWPTALLAGGALAGVLVALLCRLVAAFAARRRARKVRQALLAAVDAVGRELVLDPVGEELARARRFARLLATAHG